MSLLQLSEIKQIIKQQENLAFIDFDRKLIIEASLANRGTTFGRLA